MPQERHLSLELEGQRVPCGPSWACLFLGICDFVGQLYPTQAIAVSVFILIAVILSLPHCCLSLWKHFISICLVHSRTWCCQFLHILQSSVFTFSWRSFSNSPAPSAVSLHFRKTFSFLSYMCISYSSSLTSSKSLASQYCFRYMYSFTNPRLDLFQVDLSFTWLPDNYVAHVEGRWWYI